MQGMLEPPKAGVALVDCARRHKVIFGQILAYPKFVVKARFERKDHGQIWRRQCHKNRIIYLFHCCNGSYG